jgi:hypothetical protein
LIFCWSHKRQPAGGHCAGEFRAPHFAHYAGYFSPVPLRMVAWGLKPKGGLLLSSPSISQQFPITK